MILGRDIISDVKGVPQSFSSWDTCMSENYCKIPVIVGIVVGALILISILWCLVRCCMGAAICCCECATCCGLCCSGNHHHDSRRRSRGEPKYAQPPPPPAYPYPYQPYPQAGPMNSNPSALPAMPSWSDNRYKHVSAEAHELPRMASPAPAPIAQRDLSATGPYTPPYSPAEYNPTRAQNSRDADAYYHPRAPAPTSGYY